MESPIETVRRYNGRRIRVRLKNGMEIYGKLERCDTYMNMVLSEAKENDVNTNTIVRVYGSIMIRGSNVLFIIFE